MRRVMPSWLRQRPVQALAITIAMGAITTVAVRRLVGAAPPMVRVR